MFKHKLHPLYFVAPSAHFGLCTAIALGWNSGEGGWTWFPLFLVDFPFSILLLPLLNISKQPYIVFGILGTLWWYFASIIIGWIVKEFRDIVRRSKFKRAPNGLHEKEK